MGVKDSLERGKKLNAVLKASKAANADAASCASSKGSKKKTAGLSIQDPTQLPEDLPYALETDVGGVGLTLGQLMKREKISYNEAVQVYLAYQDCLKSDPGPSPKSKASKASKASNATKASSKRGREESTEAENGKGKKPKQKAKNQKHDWEDEEEPATKPPALLRKSAFCEDSDGKSKQDHEAPTRRVRSKTPPARKADDAAAQEAAAQACAEEDDSWDSDMEMEWCIFRYGEDAWDAWQAHTAAVVREAFNNSPPPSPCLEEGEHEASEGALEEVPVPAMTPSLRPHQPVPDPSAEDTQVLENDSQLLHGCM